MRFRHLYKTFPVSLTAIVIMSCSSYVKMPVESRITIPDGVKLYDADTFIIRSKKQIQKSVVIRSEKFLICKKSFTPESSILNEGVKEAENGNFIEAEILFKQVISDITDGTVENNLAVIYELTKRKKEAVKFYASAIEKSRENQQIKSNLLSFINLNPAESQK